MTTPIEQVYCADNRLWQTRVSCGEMHRRANAASRKPGQERPMGPCVDCPIGEAHRAGRKPKPDVPTRLIDPLDVVRAMGPDPVAAKGAARRLERAEQEGEMAGKKRATKKSAGGRPAKLYEHDGKAQPLSAWAKELGVTATQIRRRLRKGWTLEQALTTPRRAWGTSAKPAKPPVVKAYDKLRAKGAHFATPAEVLEAAGYTIEAEAETPSGLMVIVTRAGAA